MINKFIICGFSGVGKSRALDALSVNEKDFGLSDFLFIDTDAYIEKKLEVSIPQFLKENGEKDFRKEEFKALRELLSKEEPLVISVGGGIFTEAETRELVTSSPNTSVVYLSAKEETIWNRVLLAEELAADKTNSKSSKLLLRPLLAKDGSYSREKLHELFEERQAAFLEVLDVRLETDYVSEKALVEELAFLIKSFSNKSSSRQETTVIPAELRAGKVSVHFAGSGVRKSIPAFINQSFSKLNKLGIVIDENLDTSWGQELEDMLLGSNYLTKAQLVKIKITPGEKSKSFEVFNEASEKLSSAGLSREDALLCVGGGVIGDLGGLLASTFLRGIGLVHLASSVVAQVDSSIGGKTGINLSTGKNLVGTFYPARGVFLDITLLKTLPEREYLSGLAEVIKYGAIFDREFFNWLTEESENIKNRNESHLKHLVEASLKFKIETVASDLEDKKGKRALLNFGHTFGHAIEKLGSYKYHLHGEAIAIGMCWAAELGEKLGITKAGERDELEKLFNLYSLPTSLEEDFCKEYLAAKSQDSLKNQLRSQDWREALLQDKKSLGESISFIFIKEIGESLTKDYSVDKLLKGLERKLSK